MASRRDLSAPPPGCARRAERGESPSAASGVGFAASRGRCRRRRLQGVNLQDSPAACRARKSPPAFAVLYSECLQLLAVESALPSAACRRRPLAPLCRSSDHSSAAMVSTTLPAGRPWLSKKACTSLRHRQGSAGGKQRTQSERARASCRRQPAMGVTQRQQPSHKPLPPDGTRAWRPPAGRCGRRAAAPACRPAAAPTRGPAGGRRAVLRRLISTSACSRRLSSARPPCLP